MLALLAAVTFGLDVVFRLASVSTGRLSLIALGLCLFALHFVVVVPVVSRTHPRP